MTAAAERVLLRPKFVALDTSHLARLIDDAASDNLTRRSRADAFSGAFADHGGVLLLSWHHLQELLTHGDPAVIAGRTNYIQSLKLVATPRAIGDESLPGSIVDLQGLEVLASFENPDAGPEAVRDVVARGFHRVLSGEAIIRRFVEAWPILKDAFPEQAAQS
jgi:hypothetical protein